MLVIRNTEHFRIETYSIVTIGTFDGVHLGHQKILARLNEIKEKTGLKTVVLTFDPHPRKVLFPEQKDLRLLTTIDEKLELFEKYKVDIAVVYPFTNHFSQLDSDFYVNEILCKNLKVKYLVIGYDHRFGKNRTGDIDTLKEISKNNAFIIEEISAKDIDSIFVSSSKIRKALEEGDVTLARDYLGYNYFLKGTIIKGKQLGRTIGYPTANLKINDSEKMIPRIGVYFVNLIIDNQTHYGMLNIGINPTTDQGNELKIEVHIFNFNQEVYGKSVEMSFFKRLRDEEKFSNLTELKRALKKDEEDCIKLMEIY
mgnify:CR=1 FL=1